MKMMKKSVIGLALLVLAFVIGISGPVSAQIPDGLPPYMQDAYITQNYVDVAAVSLVSDLSAWDLFAPVYAPASYPIGLPALEYSISALPLSNMPIIGDISASTSSTSISPSGVTQYNQYISASGTISNFYFSASYTG